MSIIICVLTVRWFYNSSFNTSYTFSKSFKNPRELDIPLFESLCLSLGKGPGYIRLNMLNFLVGSFDRPYMYDLFFADKHWFKCLTSYKLFLSVSIINFLDWRKKEFSSSWIRLDDRVLEELAAGVCNYFTRRSICQICHAK